MVKIIEADAGPRTVPHVFVYTYPKPNDPNVRLATITWAIDKSHQGDDPPSSLAREAVPMSHEDAMAQGTMIATTYGFPTLYWQKD